MFLSTETIGTGTGTKDPRTQAKLNLEPQVGTAVEGRGATSAVFSRPKESQAKRKD